MSKDADPTAGNPLRVQGVVWPERPASATDFRMASCLRLEALDEAAELASNVYQTYELSLWSETFGPDKAGQVEQEWREIAAARSR